MRYSSQKTIEGTVENGQPSRQAKRIPRQLILEQSKPQVLMVYTDGSVTKPVRGSGGRAGGGGGGGVTVKQGATTIHEDIPAYEVSTSCLTMEMEAVTHALRCIASRGDVTVRPRMPSFSHVQ